jgi:hypothetical protein
MAKIASCDHYPSNAIFRNWKGQAQEIRDKKADLSPPFWGFEIEQTIDKTLGNRPHRMSDAKRCRQILTTFQDLS